MSLTIISSLFNLIFISLFSVIHSSIILNLLDLYNVNSVIIRLNYNYIYNRKKRYYPARGLFVACAHEAYKSGVPGGWCGPRPKEEKPRDSMAIE